MRLSADDVARLLHARRSGAGWIARCPAHEDRTPSLSIGEGRDGRLLLFCHAGCAYAEVLDAIRLLYDDAPPAPPQPRARGRAYCGQKSDLERRIRRARDVWRSAHPAAETLVETYLRARGVALPDGADLRFAPRLRHPSGAHAPAMVGAIRDREGALMGVHRTWIAEDGAGKAALSPPKAMLGRASGGAVHLAHHGSPLIAAEGIETTLAALAVMPSAAAWAALSAPGLAALELPLEPAALFIAGDGDEAGRRAASELGERAEALGWTVEARIAPPGCDWNDVLREARHAKR